MVYRWERGIKAPSPFYQERLCQVFGLLAEQLGLVELDERSEGVLLGGAGARWWGDTPAPSELLATFDPITARILTETGSSDLERRAALQGFLALAGSVVFGPPVDLLGTAPARAARLAAEPPSTLDAATQTYRQLFQGVPSHQLTRPVIAHFQLVSELAQDATSPELRAQLLASLGQVAQLAGRLSFDRNDYPAARAYHKVAIQAGQEGQSPEVAAYGIGCLASISSDCGYPKEALALLTSFQCQDVARRTTPTTRAWLAALEGEVGALLGDEHRSLRALERSRQLLSRSAPADTPVWMRFSDRSRLAAYEGFCAMRLQRADAEQTLRVAADSLAPIYTKRRSAVLADLAAHYARSHDIDRATEAVARSFRLALETDSAIYAERAGAVRRHLERHARRHPAVKQLREQLDAMRVA